MLICKTRTVDNISKIAVRTLNHQKATVPRGCLAWRYTQSVLRLSYFVQLHKSSASSVVTKTIGEAESYIKSDFLIFLVFSPPSGNTAYLNKVINVKVGVSLTNVTEHNKRVLSVQTVFQKSEV